MQGGPGGQPSPQFMQQWYAMFFQRISPQNVPVLQQWFKSVDKDNSGKISAQELAGMTFPGAPGSSQLAGKPIGLPVAQKVVAVFDQVSRREIDFFEYAAFFEFCQSLQSSFQQMDRNRSGSLQQPQEVHQALQQAQFQCSAQAVGEFFRARAAPGRGLDLAGFLNVTLDLCAAKQAFQMVDADRDGKITMDEAFAFAARLNQGNPQQAAQCVIF